MEKRGLLIGLENHLRHRASIIEDWTEFMHVDGSSDWRAGADRVSGLCVSELCPTCPCNEASLGGLRQRVSVCSVLGRGNVV